MGRFENAEVFRDTERMCRENGRLRAVIAASRKGQRLIVEGAAVDGVDLNRFDAAAQVVAAAAKAVVADYLHAFRAIEFAVYCRPGDSANFDAFVNA